MRRTPYGGSESEILQAELLKLQETGQFPDESAKIKGAQIHSVGVPASGRTRNNRHKGNRVRGTIIIVSTVL